MATGLVMDLRNLPEQVREDLEANADRTGLISVALAHRVALKYMRQAAHIGTLSIEAQVLLSTAAQLYDSDESVGWTVAVAAELIAECQYKIQKDFEAASDSEEPGEWEPDASGR